MNENQSRLSVQKYKNPRCVFDTNLALFSQNNINETKAGDWKMTTSDGRVEGHFDGI